MPAVRGCSHPGSAVDGQRTAERRRRHGQRTVGGEAADRGRPAQRDVIQPPVGRRDLPGPVQAGDREPDQAVRYPVPQLQHVAGAHVQEGGRRDRQGRRDRAPADGSAGQWPDTSAACAVTAWSVAASTICTVRVLPGAAGRAVSHETERVGPVGPVEGERRSFQRAAEILSRQQGGVLRALGGGDVAADDERRVPVAWLRSCRTARGRAWLLKVTSAVASAAATPRS